MAQAGARQEPADLHDPQARAAAPDRERGRGARARLRLPGRPADADRRRAAGDDRPRQRPDHDRPGRGRRRRARAPAHGDGRALPHAAGPSAPRGRPLLLGPAGRRPGRLRRVPRHVRRRAPGLWRGAEGALCAQRRRPLGRCLCQLLRPGPPVGGLRRDLGALPAHRRHAGDRRARSGSGSTRRRRRSDDLSAEVDFDVYRVQGIEPIVEAWLPLSFAVNSLNRSMGLPDLYPFVLSPAGDREAGLHPPPGPRRAGPAERLAALHRSGAVRP